MSAYETLARIAALEKVVREHESRIADLEPKAPPALSELSARYEAKFGKKPHHLMKAETILAALDG